MKKISNVLLVALISLGSVAAVPVVHAGDSLSCSGRCDTETQDKSLHRGWSVAGTDDPQPLQDGAALWRWWHVAGADDTEAAQDSGTARADNDEERETMASYRLLD